MSLQSKTSVARRDKRITIQAPVVADGAAGSDLVTYEDFCQAWAEVRQGELKVFEQFEADRLTAEQMVIFNIRYRGDLNTRMRVVYNQRGYRIIGYIEKDRKTSLLIKSELIDETIQ